MPKTYQKKPNMRFLILILVLISGCQSSGLVPLSPLDLVTTVPYVLVKESFREKDLTLQDIQNGLERRDPDFAVRCMNDYSCNREPDLVKISEEIINEAEQKSFTPKRWKYLIYAHYYFSSIYCCERIGDAKRTKIIQSEKSDDYRRHIQISYKLLSEHAKQFWSEQGIYPEHIFEDYLIASYFFQSIIVNKEAWDQRKCELAIANEVTEWNALVKKNAPNEEHGRLMANNVNQCLSIEKTLHTRFRYMHIGY